MKNINLILILTVFSLTAIAQSNPMDKKLEKAKEMARKEKYDDADKYLENLLADNPSCGQCWDLLALIRQKLYNDSKKTDNLLGNITVKTEGTSNNDSASKAVADLFSNFKLSDLSYNKFIYTLRKGLLFSDESYKCAILFRNIMVDIDVDTNLSKKALKYFHDAEEEFGKQNYGNAAKSYRRALEEQPDFYKASLYLGDSYYFDGNHVEAIRSFKEAVEKFPDFLEPRKYLVDTYLKENLYEDALKESIYSMTIYPDYGMNDRIYEAAFRVNKKLNIKWTPRQVFPNSMDTTQQGFSYNDPDKPEAKGPWIFYQKAKEKIAAGCNEKGVIVILTPLTQSKYLEVYSWEEMLKNSKDPSLEEARKKQQDGFLDCYALVTCFHHDFYDQYLDFVSKNRQRIIEYFNKYLVSR